MFSQIIAQNVTRSFVLKVRTTHSPHVALWTHSDRKSLLSAVTLPSMPNGKQCKCVHFLATFCHPTWTGGILKWQILPYPTQVSHKPGASPCLRTLCLSYTVLLEVHVRDVEAILVLHHWFCSTGWSVDSSRGSDVTKRTMLLTQCHFDTFIGVF